MRMKAATLTLLIILASLSLFGALPAGAQQDAPATEEHSGAGGQALPPQADGDNRDIVPIAPLTAGAAAGAAAILLLITFIRLRAGWEPHRPPEGSQADHLGHPDAAGGHH